MLNAAGMTKATNFWREVLRRLITIIFTLATLCLPYRGHHEMVGNGQCEGGNFLGLIKMQIDLGDSFIKELVEKPAGATKYLSPSIQNEIIKMLGDATRRNIIDKIKEAPWFSLIFDTTSDICGVDQISIIVRWVDLSTVSITETFIGFIVASDGGTAKALSKTVIAYLVSVGLNPLKIRGQGYDGATVMSGDKGDVNVIISDHLKENGIESPAPYVHCASHNLNLVINDAAESNVQSITFFGVLEELYNFFNRSINRSADLKKLAQQLGCITTAGSAGEDSKLTLKRLCTTRWSSRIDTIRATKNRLGDIIQLLKGYIKDSKNKEKQDAQNLLEHISTMEFVILLNTWEKILSSINLASKDLQAVDMDLGKSASELGRALNSVREMRGQWNEILRESAVFALKVGITVSSFIEKRTIKVRRFFDEEARDEPIADPEKKFRVEVFFKVIDTVTLQLEERFGGQNFVAKTFNFLAPKSMLKMTASEVCCAANVLISTYKFDLCSEFETPEDYANDLTQEVLSYRFCFKEELLGMTGNLKKLNSAIDILKHLHKDELITSYSKLVSAIVLLLTLPVTVATAERSFSKLKIIKTYLRSSIAQDRLDALAMISIEAEEARKLSVDKMIDEFAEKKTRFEKFKM